MNVIEKNGLKLIRTEESNEALRQIREDVEISQNLSETYSYPDSMPTSLTFAAFLDEVMIGAVVLKNMRWINRKTEITIYLNKNVQGQGIGRLALEMTKDYVFNTLNFHRLEAEVFSYNKKAIQLFEKSGFKREGILREARYFNDTYHDIIRFGLLKKEFRSSNDK